MTGQWTDQFGQGDGGIHVQVNCLFVQGNEAWVSGIISSGNVGGVDVSGLPVITRVQDNGKSANDPPDAIQLLLHRNRDPLHGRAEPAAQSDDRRSGDRPLRAFSNRCVRRVIRGTPAPLVPARSRSRAHPEAGTGRAATSPAAAGHPPA